MCGWSECFCWRSCLLYGGWPSCSATGCCNLILWIRICWAVVNGAKAKKSNRPKRFFYSVAYMIHFVIHNFSPILASAPSFWSSCSDLAGTYVQLYRDLTLSIFWAMRSLCKDACTLASILPLSLLPRLCCWSSISLIGDVFHQDLALEFCLTTFLKLYGFLLPPRPSIWAMWHISRWVFYFL